MAKNPNVLIRELKKKVTQVRRQEKLVRTQLRKTMSKMKLLGKTFQRKMKAKVADAHASAYLKAIIDVQENAQKKAMARQKAVVKAITNFEKKFGVKPLKRKPKKRVAKVVKKAKK